MPIQPPSLDDRRFDDLVEELISRIPAHTPEWTNPRLGDPGRTLIELFAWLGDTLLYRANLIPERQRLVFLKLLGVRLRPAQPSRGLISLSFAKGTEMGAHSIRAGARIKGAVPFETLTETTVLPVMGEAYIKQPLSDCVSQRMTEIVNGLSKVHRIDGAPIPYQTTPVLIQDRAEPGGFDVFARSIDRALWIALLAPAAPNGTPQTGVNERARDALGGGDSGAPSLLSVGLAPALKMPDLFEQVEIATPVPVIWEITTRSTGTWDTDYLTLEPIAGTDTTQGLTRPGTLRLPLPDGSLIWAPSNDVGVNPSAGVGDAPPRLDDGERAARLIGWLRLRPRPGADVASLPLSWLGINAVEVDQRITLTGQVLGESTGAADQVFTLPGRSVDPDTLSIQVQESDRGYQPWTRVEDLGAIDVDPNVARSAPVFELDSEAGTLRFGDGIRGRLPEPQMRIRLASGRFGGGRAGNLPAGSLTEISATGVDGLPAPPMKVRQPLAMTGGEDAETLAAAERRIPASLRHRERAVTAGDYRTLAQQAPGVDVGRVEVLPRFKPRDRRRDVPGVVSVLALPAAPFGPAPNPRPDRPFIERMHAYLAARTPLATELYVIGCEYVPLGVSVGVRVREGFARDRVLYEVREAIRRLLWPLPPGGAIQEGWALGRPVRARELEVDVSRVAGVLEVRGPNLFERVEDQWRQIPPSGVDGTQALCLRKWQLPELLSVVVVGGTDVNMEAPADLSAAPNPFAQANAIAVPVISPETC